MGYVPKHTPPFFLNGFSGKKVMVCNVCNEICHGSIVFFQQVKGNHTKQKISTLYLVWTKASELADIPGVNTPIGC